MRPSVANLVAAAVALGAPGPARAFGVRCDPPALVLGSGAAARIDVDTDGDVAPRITVSAGRVENVRRVAAGRFAADYFAPGEPYPQVAIVAAVASGTWRWAALPLSGHGVAVARSAPGAPIRVRIGDAAFGPVRADANGEAQVPVIVPPGIDAAYHRDQPLPLHVPRSAHVYVALERDAVPADAEQDVPVRVFAVTPAGAPREGAPVELTVTEGRVTDLAEVAPGEWSGSWRLPAGAAARVSAVARLGDEPGIASIVSLERPPGRPARLSISAARARATVGEREAVALRVTVADAAGNAVADAPTLVASAGAVSPPAAAGAGAWNARLEVPGAPGRVDVIARAAGLEDRVTLEIAPAAIAPQAAEGPEAAAAPAARERRISLAPKLGLAAAAGGMRATVVSVEGLWATALAGGRLALGVELGAFGRERTDRPDVGGQALEVRGAVRFLPLTASARLHVEPAARHLAWAGLAAGAAAVTAEIRVSGGAVRSESGAVAVAEAFAGWGWRAGRLVPFAEARAGRYADPGFEALRGSLSVFTFALGCRYDAY